MNQQWETCCLTDHAWSYEENKRENKREWKHVLDFYSPQGTITKFPTIKRGHIIGILNAVGWELVTAQHAMYIPFGVGTAVTYYEWGWLECSYQTHPSGDEKKYNWLGADMILYFKRSIQSGRPIDDAQL